MNGRPPRSPASAQIYGDSQHIVSGADQEHTAPLLNNRDDGMLQTPYHSPFPQPMPEGAKVCMNTDIPYLVATGNVPKILAAVQKAGAPKTFNVDFIKDLGFTSSQDRPMAKLFKYLGLTDSNGHPLAAYREFMDEKRSRVVLAGCLRIAFDDLFLADKSAHEKTPEQLKGWFKTKTGVSDSVADKIARTFKALANYADFKAVPLSSVKGVEKEDELNVNGNPAMAEAAAAAAAAAAAHKSNSGGAKSSIGLVYRFEIHLPDTQNVDTFRAIFRALREELM